MIKFCAGHRIKPTYSTTSFQPPSIPLSSNLAIVLLRRNAYRVSLKIQIDLSKKSTIKFQHSEFTVWTTRVSNPVCYPHFRPSTSVYTKKSPSLMAFLYILADFTLSYKIPLFCIKLKVKQYLMLVLKLGFKI